VTNVIKAANVACVTWATAAVVLAGVVVGLGLAPASAAGAPAPEITKVAPGDITVPAGSVVPLRVKVKNSASRKSRPLPLILLLSENGSVDDAQTVGSGSVAALRRRSRSTVPLTATIPATAEDDDYELMVCKPRAGRSPKCFKDIEVDVEPPTTTATTSSGSTSGFPSRVLNLSPWKLTLPTGSSENPTEILQPQLNSFVDPQFFHLDGTGTGVVFRANVDGVTTSGSSYPRSELREMLSNSSTKASWDSRSGTHVMTITQAITHTPVNKPHVVAGQIHDGSDDVIQIRLEGQRLFVSGNDNQVQYDLDTSYVLGTRFTVRVTATASGISVDYNGVRKVTNYARSGSGWYFKAGCYTQSNTSYDASTAYGEVVIYQLTVQH
jgi:poly(beta-D-mannuronate) lyase